MRAALSENPRVSFSTTLYREVFTFPDVKDVLARANEPRSGDEQAGLAPVSKRQMAAAKRVLAALTLKELRENPAVPYETDEVTRVVEDGISQSPVATHAYQRVSCWTVSDLREFILDDATTGDQIKELSPGLTPEMVAGVAKLMSNMDLVMAGQKIRVTAVCNNTIGLPGRLASRLQPNHPRDDVDGIIAAVKDGLSFGNGDAVIGINPSTDDVDKVKDILSAVKDFMRRFRVPTQNCVLAHLTAQMEAMQRGAPLDLMFQSIAGSEGANKNFGVSVSLLDEAYDMTLREGTAKGPNVMYFETGQGTALSANAHHGTDQVTMEARAYGLARRYRPFLVNSVVGFIGPEYLRNGKQITRAKGPAVNPLAYLGQFFKQPRLIAGWLYAVIRSCGWWVYVVYVPIYCIENGLGETLGGVMLSTTNATLLLSPLMAAWVRRVSVRAAMRGSLAYCAVLFIGASLLSHWPMVALGLLYAGSFGLVMLDVVGGLPFMMSVKPSERSEMAAVYSSFRDVSGIATPGAAWLVLWVAPLGAIFSVSGAAFAGAFVMAGALHSRLGAERPSRGRA